MKPQAKKPILVHVTAMICALIIQSKTIQARPDDFIADLDSRYAAMVLEAKSGQILYAVNADIRLFPASLVKIMTLYLTFQAIEAGEISPDTLVTISENAAQEPPSRLGLTAGQEIALRYLVQAVAIKSANDAATAIAEAIGGSQEAFVQRMNATAARFGMVNTRFANAAGLSAPRQYATSLDMAILGRQLFLDFPEYFHLFSAPSANAGLKVVRNTNRRFLESYPGADGIMAGYSVAAGFNLVASAHRGCKRVIAVVFGTGSVKRRTDSITSLLDLGLQRAGCGGQIAVLPPFEDLNDDGVRIIPVGVSPVPRPVRRPLGNFR